MNILLTLLALLYFLCVIMFVFGLIILIFHNIKKYKIINKIIKYFSHERN